MFLVKEKDFENFNILIKGRKEISYFYQNLLINFNYQGVDKNEDVYKFWFEYQQKNNMEKNTHYFFETNDLIKIYQNVIKKEKISKSYNTEGFIQLNDFMYNKEKGLVIALKKYLPNHNLYHVKNEFFNMIETKVYHPNKLEHLELYF